MQRWILCAGTGTHSVWTAKWTCGHAAASFCPKHSLASALKYDEDDNGAEVSGFSS